MQVGALKTAGGGLIVAFSSAKDCSKLHPRDRFPAQVPIAVHYSSQPGSAEQQDHSMCAVVMPYIEAQSVTAHAHQEAYSVIWQAQKQSPRQSSTHLPVGSLRHQSAVEAQRRCIVGIKLSILFETVGDPSSATVR